MSVFSLRNKSIKQLVELSSELKDIGSTIALLSWDQETYITAQGAITRARQLETLSGIYHQHGTAKKLGSVLEKLREEITSSPQSFSEYDTALVHEMQREYDIATKLPEKLVKELSKECSLGLESWKHARVQNDFSLFEKNLTHMIELKRTIAETIGYADSPYDALLDEFEAGLTKKEVTRVFDILKPQLKKLIPLIAHKTTAFEHGLFNKEYDEKKLWDLSMEILTAIGFDLERGRQDKSIHPFTMGLDNSDVRLTTRILSSNPISTLMSSIHEGGHGMYEQGISSEITHTTLGYVNSLVAHESQSRFWENMIGKSPEFWEYFFPKMQRVFPEHLLNATAKQAWEEVNVVKPSLIRVDADEVSYHMHIIIRTEIETELIEGMLKAKDVPERWRSAYKEYLGIDVPDDAQGPLQDIHWSQGLIGYFPTYSLGSIFAAQLYATLQGTESNISHSIAEGKFELPLHWLNEQIHQHGRLYTSSQLCERITGKPLSSNDFITYIEKKFDIG